MVDLDPEIWNNKTLGAASDLPFLDEIEEQDRENRSAKAEGRKPRLVVKRDRFPGAQAGSWRTPPSNDTGMDFVTEEVSTNDDPPHDPPIDTPTAVIADSGVGSVDSGNLSDSGPKLPNTVTG